MHATTFEARCETTSKTARIAPSVNGSKRTNDAPHRLIASGTNVSKFGT